MEAIGYRDFGGGVREQFKVHYYLPAESHEMDAQVRNRCEGEILGLLKEISRTLGVPFKVDATPPVAGGLEEHLLLVGQYKEQILFIKDIVLAVMTIGGGAGGLLFVRSKLKHAGQTTTLNDLSIEKARLEIDRMRQDAEEKKAANGGLPLEDKQSPSDIAAALLGRKKIKHKRSEFYRELASYNPVEAVGFSNSHHKSAKEEVVPRTAFAEFIVAPEDLQPEIFRRVEIEVVSPVLKSGNHNWRAIFQRKGISFEMGDREFRRSVIDQEVQFQNGTKLICDLEIYLRDNEAGEPDVIRRVVTKVHAVIHVSKWNPAEQGELELPDPDV